MRCVILLAVIGAAVAASGSEQRIVGGSAVDVNDYPFMANMQFGLLGGLFWRQRCGGTILSNDFIMSSAHCYYQNSVKVWRVLLGTSFPDHGGFLHEVHSFILHPEYNDNTMENDIALVRLSSPAIYSDTIRNALIPGTNYVVADGAALTAIGWGQTNSDGSTPEHLQKVDIFSINLATCAQAYAELKAQPGYAYWPDVKSTMLCAGIPNMGGRDACVGDNGGPIVQSTNIVVGITSWAYGCGLPGFPGVKTRVSSHTDWILANTIPW